MAVAVAVAVVAVLFSSFSGIVTDLNRFRLNRARLKLALDASLNPLLVELLFRPIDEVDGDLLGAELVVEKP